VDVKPLDPTVVSALLEAQGQAIRGEMEALPAELRGRRPAPEEWSANEVLGHLIEAERRGFNGRIRTILAQEKPSLADWNQVEVARERADDRRDGLELLKEFMELRSDSVALAKGVRADQLARTGEHSLVGTISVGDLLHEWVHHDRNHVRQLFAVTQAFVWPNMGNCRRFAEFD
jgi:hypothetical protein